MPELRGIQPFTPSAPPPKPSQIKLYELRVVIRAYLYSEAMRLIEENGEGVALDDCSLRFRVARRLRTLQKQGVCEEPVVSPDPISENYDEWIAKLTPFGAFLVGEVLRRCIPDGRILRD